MAQDGQFPAINPSRVRSYPAFHHSLFWTPRQIRPSGLSLNRPRTSAPLPSGCTRHYSIELQIDSPTKEISTQNHITSHSCYKAYPLLSSSGVNPAALAVSSHESTLSNPERLKALLESGLLDTPPEQIYDRFTRLASQLLGCPVSLISLVDRDRQFFKSATGLSEPLKSARQTPLSHSFCQYVVSSGLPLTIEDARLHPLVCKNPAIQDYGVIAYLGMPLTTQDGHTLGSLCVVDTKPREWPEQAVTTLHELAGMVMTEMELRATARALRQVYLDLREAEIARDELAQMLVHDLRNPLTSMMVALEMFDPQFPELQEATLELAKQSGGKLIDMVEQILEVGKADSGRMSLALELYAPSTIVLAARDQVIHSAINQRVQIETRFGQHLGMVTADADKLRRVLVNLLANAIQHSPEETKVIVAVENEPGTENLVFTVSDSGEGIPAALQGKIFQKYSAVKSKKAGVASCGLGLAFCQRAVAAHGGEITFTSEAGRGTTFRVTIPRSPSMTNGTLYEKAGHSKLNPLPTPVFAPHHGH